MFLRRKNNRTKPSEPAKKKEEIKRVETNCLSIFYKIIFLSLSAFLVNIFMIKKIAKISNDDISNLPVNRILAKSLMKQNGDNGWVVNPGSNNVNGTYNCTWLDFESKAGNTAKICGHSVRDYITSEIKKHKRWRDCDHLPRIWNETHKTERSIYVEIGANIGSCVMEMLLSTNANIVAFEPHPRNQYALQMSIEALGRSYQNRVVFIPIALGSESAQSTIYSGEGNMGNSMLGKFIKDWPNQVEKQDEKHVIQVEPFSSILNTYNNIVLMKLDAQGFECNILDGITQDVANNIQQIFFEVSSKFLRPNGCLGLLDKFRNLGFTVYNMNGDEIYDGVRRGTTYDLLAYRKLF